MILSVLRSTDTHPSADWVYQEVKQVLPHISLGTVYRNLRILVESGEALELCFGSASSRFDGNPHNHYHFVCQHCGNVYDLTLPVDLQLSNRVSEDSGHQVYDHRLEFYGSCRDCQVEGTASQPQRHDS